jgi:hypothetical protein
MEVAGIQMPGSDNAFKYGAGITFGIVLLLAIINAIPVLGFLAGIFGIPVAFVAGAIGGGYAVNTDGLAETGEGAKLGGAIGAIGNFAAAIIGVVLGILVSIVTSTILGAAGGSSASGLAAGIGGGIIGGLITGVIGIVTGTIIAAIGGLIGGVVVTAMMN